MECIYQLKCNIIEMNLVTWAMNIGYIPVTNTDEELAEYIRNQNYHLRWLTQFAVINEEVCILDWLEEYHLLDPTIVVRTVAAAGSINMIEYCRDHGYDLSDCCWVAWLYNHKPLLNWLQINGCCDSHCQYHKNETE
jgi:hypothetical protein